MPPTVMILQRVSAWMKGPRDVVLADDRVGIAGLREHRCLVVAGNGDQPAAGLRQDFALAGGAKGTARIHDYHFGLPPPVGSCRLRSTGPLSCRHVGLFPRAEMSQCTACSVGLHQFDRS